MQTNQVLWSDARYLFHAVKRIGWVRHLRHKTGINPAGEDLVLSCRGGKVIAAPLFLEINHYFGRRAPGGSDK